MTSLPTLSGYFTAVKNATPPPSEYPTRSGFSSPRWSMSAAMSSAMSRMSIGRSMSAVRPCPCRSGAMTWWFVGERGMIGPNISPDPSPPCSRISGRPVPCVS